MPVLGRPWSLAFPVGAQHHRARSLHLSNPGSLVPLGEMGLAGRDRARYIYKLGVERTQLDLEREPLELVSKVCSK